MNNITISATKETPEVELNYDSGLIRLSGRSLSPNPIETFSPINKWLNDYVKQPKEITRIELQLEYFNSSSRKQIADLLLRLKNEIVDKEVRYNWLYEDDDEDILLDGKELERILNIKFNYIVKNQKES